MVAAALAFFLIAILYILPSMDPHRYDDFASCLSSKGVKLYGSLICPHCSEQKELFGDSLPLIDYVECYDPSALLGMSAACREAGIQAYPAWEFPGPVRVSGTLSIEEISHHSGCPLP